jgi:general secretion pathway protein C
MSESLSSGLKSGSLLANLPEIFIASQSKISALATIVLLSSSGWVGGQLLWNVAEPAAAVQMWRAKPAASGAEQKRDADISGLLNANLFGKYSQQQVVQPVVPVNTAAPKTRLNLVLVGAVSSSNPGGSLAVIANRGSQATYGVGEVIEGTRATLKAVLVDRVIIENDGRDETLMLEGVDYTRQPASVNARQSSARVRNSGNNPSYSDPSEKLAQIRQEITTNPQKLLQYIRLSQVRGGDGAVAGYKVRPGKDRLLFESVGLRDGDIATHINGNSLADPASMGKVMQSLADLTELNLTVTRDGQSEEIYIQF